MSLSDDIAEVFDLTKIEADELERKGLALASSFVDLRSAYSIDYLTESEAYAEAKKQNIGKTGLKALYGKAINRLSSDANTMWKRFEAAKTAHDEFEAVCGLHSVSTSIDGALTQIFEFAYEQNQLRRPEEVAEGRRLFESLSRAKRSILLSTYLDK